MTKSELIRKICDGQEALDAADFKDYVTGLIDDDALTTTGDAEGKVDGPGKYLLTHEVEVVDMFDDRLDCRIPMSDNHHACIDVKNIKGQWKKLEDK